MLPVFAWAFACVTVKESMPSYMPLDILLKHQLGLTLLFGH